MITQKYDYKKLKRQNVNGKRHYILEGSDVYAPMPSVTTILSLTKSEEDKAVLANWKKRVGSQQAQAISTEAASRGTRMHKYLEDYCKDSKLATPGTNPHAQHANKMASVIIEKAMRQVTAVYAVEAPVCHPNIYAGTSDIIMDWNGNLAIGDFKQSNRLKKEEWIGDYFLQATAYGEAHNALFGTDIRTAVIMICTKDLEYQEFVIEGEEYDKHRRLWWHRVEKYFEL